MKRILVTGASGLVGGAIVEAVAQTNEVYGLWWDNELSPLSNVISSKVDLRDSKSVSAIHELEPQVVIHCAARIPKGGPDGDKESAGNIAIMDDHVFQAVKLVGSELIYISTTMVYDFPATNDLIREDFVPEKMSEYAAQKRASEISLLENLHRGLILRINAPYGPMMRQESVIKKFIRNALLELPLIYFGSGSRSQDFTHVHDIANLVDCLVSREKLPTGCYNIAQGKPISMKKLAKLVVQVLGSRSDILQSSEPDPQELYRAKFDIHRAISELDWAPRISLEEGILQMANHLQAR